MQNIQGLGQPHHENKLKPETKSAVVHLQKITTISLLVYNGQRRISNMYPTKIIRTFEPLIQVQKHFDNKVEKNQNNQLHDRWE